VSELLYVLSVGKITIFLTDSEQRVLQTVSGLGTTEHCTWNPAGDCLLDWSRPAPVGADLGKSTLNLSPLPFPSRVPRAFSEASDPPDGSGGSCGTCGAAALAGCGVPRWGLRLEPGRGRRRAARTRGRHSFAQPSRSIPSPTMEQPPLESRSCLLCLGSYAIHSSILPPWIHFFSCRSCHICHLPAGFPFL